MMTTTQETFNLVDRPWIRVRALDGGERLLSGREVFEQSRTIERIAGESPQQDAAVLRVLLAAWWSAVREEPQLSDGDARAAGEWWIDQFTSTDVPGGRVAMDRYWNAVRGRWDLLDPVAPFMQVSDLHTAKGEWSSVRKLLPDAESSYFTLREGDAAESLALDEAARWLVHLQAWNYSGIKSGAVGDPRVKGGRGYPIGTGWSGKAGVVVLHGRDLAETLLLNTPPTKVFLNDVETDRPVWEREPDMAASRGVEAPAGPRDLLTWQIRRVRLRIEDGRVTGAVVSNGDRIELKNQFADPMTAYRHSIPQSKKAGTDVWMPREHSESRTLWRGVEPLLLREGMASSSSRDRPPATTADLSGLHQELRVADVEDVLIGVEMIGTVYGTQDAVVTSTIREELPLRLAALTSQDPDVADTIVTAAKQTMDAAVDLGRLAGNLAVAAGGEYSFVAAATEAALAGLTEPFKGWLARVGPDADLQVLRDQWFASADRHLRAHGARLVAGAGPVAVVGREDADGRLHSAATAWGSFTYAIDKTLDGPARRRRNAPADTRDETVST
ncbi:type I-E CRISPR-associated protein Cse1/CasA [Micrococcus flavus]|nr:type I-E CRISPR-associated protein Cse1/CasA [Micrococcus flavus]